MLEYEEIEESELPPLTDEKMIELANEMGEEFEVYRKTRQVLENDIWPECDKAFHAIKSETLIPTVRMVDNGMIGDSTLREAVKTRRNQLINAVMPPDESWLEMASLNDEDDEDALSRAKEFNIHLMQQAQMKSTMEPVADQLFIRGATAIGWNWQTRVRIRRMAKPLAKTLEAVSEDLTGEKVTQAQLRQIKQSVPFFDGPRTFPIDLYRLYWDPTVNIDLEPDIPMVYVFFKSLRDLKNAKDPDTKEPVYDHTVLEECQEWSHADFSKEFPSAMISTEIMGINPAVDTEDKFVPIFLFHKQVRETEEGEVYVDKFFYVARTSTKGGWRIIRVQDNPSTEGHKPFFFTVCDRWMSLPYGSGVVEKSLASYKTVNIMKDLTVTGQALNVLPPYSYLTGMTKDGGRPKWMIGAGTEINYRPNIGMDWIKPFPINPNNLVLSMTEIRSIRQDMVAQVGTNSTAMSTDRNKSISKAKTATEIRQESVEGSSTDQVLTDKFATDIVQPTAQAISDFAVQRNPGGVSFVSRNPQSGQLKNQRLSGDELARPRALEIVGRRGQASKAHEINNLLELLDVLTKGNAAGILPNLAMIMQDILLALVGRFGVPMKPEYRMTPLEITMGNPQAQLEMLKAALQSEEGQQMAIEILMQNPQVQQQIQQALDQARAQGQQEGSHAEKIQSKGAPQQ